MSELDRLPGVTDDEDRLDEEEGDCTAWMFASPERDRALVSIVCTHVRANGPFPLVRLQGLDPDRMYRREDTGETLSGAALMYGGISFPQFHGDWPAAQVYLFTGNWQGRVHHLLQALFLKMILTIPLQRHLLLR